MSLRDQLRADLKDAMRAQDAPRKAAIRMVLTNIQLAEVETSRPLEENEIVELVRKEVKRREEAVEIMRAAGREDLVADELVELKILQAYLPALMTEDEIRQVARSVIEDVGATSMADMGKVMGQIMPRVRGRADGRMVNEIVRALLSA